MSDLPNINPQLIELIKTKTVLSKDTTDVTFELFKKLKELLSQMYQSLHNQEKLADERIKMGYIDKGAFEAELKVADDILIFLMHTNAFVFDNSHPVIKTSYV